MSKPFRLLVTGSRTWTKREEIMFDLAALSLLYPEMIVVHGACPRGADAIAASCARELYLAQEPHPADWRGSGRLRGSAATRRWSRSALTFVSPTSWMGHAGPHIRQTSPGRRAFPCGGTRIVKQRLCSGADRMPLLPYQRPPVQLMLDQEHLLLAMDMGTGKTIVSIAVAEKLLDTGRISTCLCVVPAALKYQWAQALAQFTDLPRHDVKVGRERITVPQPPYCVIIDGNQGQRDKQYGQISSDTEYVILGYPNVLSDWAIITGHTWQLVVADEVTTWKNAGQRYQSGIHGGFRPGAVPAGPDRHAGRKQTRRAVCPHGMGSPRVPGTP